MPGTRERKGPTARQFGLRSVADDGVFDLKPGAGGDAACIGELGTQHLLHARLVVIEDAGRHVGEVDRRQAAGRVDLRRGQTGALGVDLLDGLGALLVDLGRRPGVEVELLGADSDCRGQRLPQRGVLENAVEAGLLPGQQRVGVGTTVRAERLLTVALRRIENRRLVDDGVDGDDGHRGTGDTEVVE